jgi:hypothetical protein
MGALALKLDPLAFAPRVLEHVPLRARDGFELLLRRVRPNGSGPQVRATRGPVLLVHGAGVRGEIFLPPTADTLPDMLCRAGFDPWLLDWRASINLPPNPWTLDDAAVNDYPAAVAKIREVTGADTIQAVIHCQGSTSFMLSITAGLLPQVRTVVSNAVALHPIVPAGSWLKAMLATDPVSRHVQYLNPQWGLYVSGFWPTMIDWWVRATHHECTNAVCKHSSFTYGAGFPTLWRHENLDVDLHEWLKGEFAHVPMTFFRQIKKCIAAGHLVTLGKYRELPESSVAEAPRTDARFVFLGGERNDCFCAAGMARTFDFFEKYAPGRHMFQELAGYGHLDVFIGKQAATDTLPLIVDELGRN